MTRLMVAAVMGLLLGMVAIIVDATLPMYLASWLAAVAALVLHWGFETL